MKKHLLIIGPQGSGKTTRAIDIAKKTHGAFDRITLADFLTQPTAMLNKELETLIIEVEGNFDKQIKKYLTCDSFLIKTPHQAPIGRKVPRFIFCCQTEQLPNFLKEIEIEILKLKG